MKGFLTRQSSLFSVIAFSAILTGCVPDMPDAIAPLPTYGVVIVGNRWENPLGFGWGGITLNLNPYDPVTGGVGHRAAGGTRYASFVSVDRTAKTVAAYKQITLIPGDYIFTSYEVNAGPNTIEFICPGLSFNVRAGEVLYLGDFVFDDIKYKNHEYSKQGAKIFMSSKPQLQSVMQSRQLASTNFTGKNYDNPDIIMHEDLCR